MLLWFLPAILLLGLVTSYTDIKKGKIKNKHIIYALVYGILAYSIFVYANFEQVRVTYFTELIIMCALSLIICFVIWYTGLWTAGDAKLFFAYSALIPLSVYRYGHMRYFDFLNILINTFVPIFLYLFIVLLLKTNLNQKLFFFKKSLEPKPILSMMLFLFAFSWLINLLFKVSDSSTYYFFIIPLLFLIFVFLEKISLKHTVYILITVSISRFVFDPGIYSFSFIKEFLFVLALFIFLRFFIIRFSFYLLTKEVDINLLKGGMVPAEFIYKEDGKFKKKESLFFSPFSHLRWGLKKKDYLFNPTEALDNEDVIKLKGLKKKLGFEHLRVQQTVPFAPFLFFGVLLTLLAQGNIFLVIKNLLF